MDSNTNTVEGNTVLKISFPLWFRVMCGIGSPIVLVLICIGLLRLTRQELTEVLLLKGAFLLFIVAVGCYAMPFIYSVVYADGSGVELRRFTRTKRKFTWNEIKTVARPRFGIPYDVVYIISERGTRIPVVRGASGYRDLLQLIQSKSPNLTPNKISANLRPPTIIGSWRGSLLFLLIFIAYIIFRIVTK